MSDLNLSLIIRAFNRAKGPTRDAANDVDYLARRTKLANDLGRNLGRVVAGGVATGLAALSALGFGAIKGSAQFEQYGIVLENLEGSAAKGRAAMLWVEKFAAKTPYDLTQVMDAFVKLKAYGIDPTDGALAVLGDTASGMGKPLMAAVEAMADAQTGEFERLKEFGIKAKVQGQQVLLTYTKDGKEMVIRAKKTGTDINRALREIWGGKFGGLMEKQSASFNGMLSNLGDWWGKFQRRIGEKGAFDKAKGIIKGWLDFLDSPAGGATLDRWASKISVALSGLLTTTAELVTSIDWPKVVSGIESVVTGGARLLGWIGGLQGLLDLGVAAMIGHLTLTLAGLGSVLTVTGGALMLTPWGWFVAAVAAVAAVAYLVIRNWGPISGFFKRLGSGIRSALGPPLTWLKNAFLNFTPLGMVIRNWGPISRFLGAVWNGVKAVVGAGFRVLRALFLNFHPLGIIIKNWGPISAKAAEIWASVKGAVSAGLSVIWGLLKSYTPLGVVAEKWEPIVGFIGRLWDRVKQACAAGWNRLVSWLRGLNSTSLIPGWLRDFVLKSEGKGAAGAPAAGGPRGAPRAPAGGGRAQKVESSAKIEVVLTGEAARQARVRGVSTKGDNIQVATRRGPVLA